MEASKKQGLSKYDSLAIKGIAILFLLFHHLYCTADRFKGYDISFYPFSQDFVVGVSFILKICVSIFAFITGYGLLKSISKTEFNRKSIFKWNVTRLVKTMSGFWFIYVIAFIATMIIDRMPVRTYFKDSITEGIFYIVNDFLGLANLLGTPTLNSTWWYMSAAIIFILMVPLVYMLSKKIGYLPVIIGLMALPRLLGDGYPGGVNAYTFIMPVIFGMIFADYNIFEKIEEHSPKNKTVAYILHLVVFSVLIVLSMIASAKYNRTVAWELTYGVVPVIFICFFRFCIIRIPVLKSILIFLGKHSMTIFLTHTFIRHTYLRDFTYSFGNFALIFIILLAVSTVLAVVLDYIKKLCGYDKLISKMLEKFNKKLA